MYEKEIEVKKDLNSNETKIIKRMYVDKEGEICLQCPMNGGPCQNTCGVYINEKGCSLKVLTGAV